MHTGRDYLVNSQNLSSRAFTVAFQSKQANSTEHVIVVANDSIVEGTEAFRLRIVTVRFIGQAAAFFRAQDGLSNTVVDVIIEDDDCKFMDTTCIICLQTYSYKEDLCLYACHACSVSSHSYCIPCQFIIVTQQ